LPRLRAGATTRSRAPKGRPSVTRVRGRHHAGPLRFIFGDSTSRAFALAASITSVEMRSRVRKREGHIHRATGADRAK
jgi:hypothetical protein